MDFFLYMQNLNLGETFKIVYLPKTTKVQDKQSASQFLHMKMSENEASNHFLVIHPESLGFGLSAGQNEKLTTCLNSPTVTD